MQQYERSMNTEFHSTQYYIENKTNPPL